MTEMVMKGDGILMHFGRQCILDSIRLQWHLLTWMENDDLLSSNNIYFFKVIGNFKERKVITESVVLWNTHQCHVYAQWFLIYLVAVSEEKQNLHILIFFPHFMTLQNNSLSNQLILSKSKYCVIVLKITV